MQQLRLAGARDQIFQSLWTGSRSCLLEELFKSGADVYVLAGAVRDTIACLYEGNDSNGPRDFDIGVAGVSREYLDGVLREFGTENRHGGFVLDDKQLPRWDVWRLEDSIGIRKTGASFSLENVLRTFNLSCNGIAVNLRTGMFLDAGAIESIRRKRLGFVERAIHHSCDTFAAKALLLQLRFKYVVPAEMNRFVKRYLEGSSLLYESFKVFPSLPIINIGNAASKAH
jgi:hypothetical protein